MTGRANFRAVFIAFAMPVLICLGGCATPVNHATPSGRVEVTVQGKVGKELRAEISNMMLNTGYNAKNSSESLMVFEKPVQNVLAAVLYGSQYDSSPAARVSYSIVETDYLTRVVASFAVVTNPGSAFERVTPMDNNPDTRGFQMRLDEMKAFLEARGK